MHACDHPTRPRPILATARVAKRFRHAVIFGRSTASKFGEIDALLQ